MNWRATCLAAACAALLACGDDDTAEAPSSTRPRGQTGSALLAKSAAQNENGSQAAQADPPSEPAQQPAAPADPEPEQEQEKPPERDLDAELHDAFGTPASCLKPRLDGPDAPAKIRISLEAHLLDNGMVTRSSASSAQLDDEELRCVRQRLSGLRLQQPIENAPRSARATVEIELKAPKKSGS